MRKTNKSVLRGNCVKRRNCLQKKSCVRLKFDSLHNVEKSGEENIYKGVSEC